MSRGRVDSQLKESVRFIKAKTTLRPRTGLIFGSGLGDLAAVLSSRQVIESSAIPHYPVSTVEGHHGRLIFGKLNKVPILAFQGRIHLYETGNIESVLYPIHIAHELGLSVLIVTNAAGAVNREFSAGDLMLITDQINLTFENPVIRRLYRKTGRHIYDQRLQSRIKKLANEQNIPLRQGVYCGLKGPSYETAAEIEMIRRIGADAVGMSTVNEVTLAAGYGMRVVGISCITNLATGIGSNKLSHVEVTEIANKVREPFSKLLIAAISGL